jgi:ABC-type multidrug transport system fused ATPase/permease subunit
MSALRAVWPFVRPYRRVLALGGLLAVLEVAVGLAQPWPLKWVVDDVLGPQGVGAGDQRGVLLMACAALALIVVMTSLLDYWSTRILSSAGLHLASSIRESVFAHLNHLSLRYHGSSRVGDLSSRVTSDVDRTQDMVIQSLAVLLPNALRLVGMVTVMVLLDPVFALLSLAATPLLAITVARATSRLREAEKRARSADGQVAAAASENFNAIHLVQAYSLEPYQQERFDGYTRVSLRAGLDAIRHQAGFSPAVDAAAAASTIAVMWFGAGRVLNGSLSIGEFLIFVSYVGSVYKPLKALSKLGRVTAKGGAAAERVRAVLDEQPQIVDRPDARLSPPLRGRIELVDVSFSYGREPVLAGIDLVIEAGETVALVGPTGAGKSTIASLIPRLIDPTSGTVMVDGIDVRALTTASLRRQVSMVLQDTVLLHGSIFDNIAVGWPGASDAAVRRAARLALVEEFSDRLPMGLDTMLGERGSNLSGGQRQRIAIARAILRNSPILILDEPTSSLDPESEEAIVEALANLPSRRTTLVIAHRLSTVRNADRIVVVDGGRITQVGTHAELVDREGRYRAMHLSSTAARPLIATGQP